MEKGNDATLRGPENSLDLYCSGCYMTITFIKIQWSELLRRFLKLCKLYFSKPDF